MCPRSGVPVTDTKGKTHKTCTFSLNRTLLLGHRSHRNFARFNMYVGLLQFLHFTVRTPRFARVSQHLASTGFATADFHASRKSIYKRHNGRVVFKGTCFVRIETT